MFSSVEVITLSVLGIFLLGIPLQNLLKKDYRSIWSPMTFICLVYFYYSFLGGIAAVVNNDIIYRLLDHRPYFLQAWQGALVAIVSILVGFNLQRNRSVILISNEERNAFFESKLFIYGRGLFAIGFMLYFVAVGGAIGSKITFWEASQGSSGYSGAFRAYFALGVNMLIVSCTLLFASNLKKKSGLMWFGIALFVALGFYLTSGFRYRLVILFVTVFSTYFLLKKKKPNVILVGSMAVVFIVVMGVINATRSYSRGLDLKSIDGVENDELFMSGLKETYTFQTTGLMMNKVDEGWVEKIGFSPIWESIVSPIPRVLWPDKPTGSYLDRILIIYSGDNQNYSKKGLGAAVLNYGEYYLAFGWIGIVFYCLILGWGCRRLWNWFLADSTNPFRIVAYCVCNAYLYMVLSRGYLPQVTMLFFFTAFPGIYIHGRVVKKFNASKELNNAHPSTNR